MASTRRGVTAFATVFAGTSGQAAGQALFAILTTRWLPPESRGGVVMFAAVGITLAVVGNGGWATEGQRRLARDGPGFGEPYRRTAWLATSVAAVLALTVGAGLLALSGSLPSPWVIPLLVGYCAGYSQFLLARAGLYGLRAYGSTAWAATATSAGLVAGAVALQLFGRLTFWTAVGLLTGLTLLGSTLLWPQFTRRVATGAPTTGDRRPASLYRGSLAALPSSLGTQIINRGDRLLLGLATGPVAVATYAAGVALSQITSLVAMSSRQIVQTETAAVPGRRAGRHERFTLVAAAACSLALIAAAGWVVPLLFGEDYVDAVEVARISAVTAFAATVHQLQLGARLGRGQYRAVAINQAIGVSLVVVLVPVAGITAGAVGAATAMLVVNLVMATVWRLPWSGAPEPVRGASDREGLPRRGSSP